MTVGLTSMPEQGLAIPGGSGFLGRLRMKVGSQMKFLGQLITMSAHSNGGIALGWNEGSFILIGQAKPVDYYVVRAAKRSLEKESFLTHVTSFTRFNPTWDWDSGPMW